MTTTMIRAQIPVKKLIGIFLFITIIFGSHAVFRHGQDAIDARNCLREHGTWQVWSQPWKGDCRLHLLTQDNDGNIFDVIVQKVKDKVYREITSFKPSPSGEGNTIENITEWLKNKSAIRTK